MNSAINPCSEHLCTQLCLLSGMRPRYYSCHCQSGWKLDADKRTCVKGMLFSLCMLSLTSLYLFEHLSTVFLITWTSLLDQSAFLMVVRESVIFGIPLDPNDPSNNAMAPVSSIGQGRDIDFDDQEELVYWVQDTVSPLFCFLFCYI